MVIEIIQNNKKRVVDETMQKEQFQFVGEQSITERTELGETLGELNKVTSDKEGNSAIDMRSNLTAKQVKAILIIDYAVHLNILPPECKRLTEQAKRIFISKGGKGREQIVEIAVGKRDSDRDRMGVPLQQRLHSGEKQ